MSDNFQVPANAVAITPSDTASQWGSALYVGVGGNVSVVTEGGDTVTFSNVQGGSTIVLRFSIVRSTSTTASNMVRMW